MICRKYVIRKRRSGKFQSKYHANFINQNKKEKFNKAKMILIESIGLIIIASFTIVLAGTIINVMKYSSIEEGEKKYYDLINKDYTTENVTEKEFTKELGITGRHGKIIW